jgi:hypothetical protein
VHFSAQKLWDLARLVSGCWQSELWAQGGGPSASRLEREAETLPRPAQESPQSSGPQQDECVPLTALQVRFLPVPTFQEGHVCRAGPGTYGRGNQADKLRGQRLLIACWGEGGGADPGTSYPLSRVSGHRDNHSWSSHDPWEAEAGGGALVPCSHLANMPALYQGH